MFKTTCHLALLASALAARPLLANDSPLANGNAATGEQLQVDFSPSKTSYEKNENISFHFRSNHAVYLYVYTTNADGSHNLILPNTLQMENYYPANQDYLIPDQQLRFQADGSTRREEVFVVASAEPIELGQAMHRAGVFHQFSDAELHRAFASKGIKIRHTDTRVITPTAVPDLNTTQGTVVKSAVRQLQILIRDVQEQ